MNKDCGDLSFVRLQLSVESVMRACLALRCYASSVGAQEITGTLGSPSATTTITANNFRLPTRTSAA